MADGLRAGAGDDDVQDWIRRTRAIDNDIEDVWVAVRSARESGRMNLRRSARERVHAADHFEALLTRLEQSVAEIRSMARTIGRCGTLAPEWDPAFRTSWLELLARAGHAVTEADGPAVAQPVRPATRRAERLSAAAR